MTFRNECDKVNELLISNESQKSLKSFEKNLKKFLTNRKRYDRINELLLRHRNNEKQFLEN